MSTTCFTLIWLLRAPGWLYILPVSLNFTCRDLSVLIWCRSLSVLILCQAYQAGSANVLVPEDDPTQDLSTLASPLTVTGCQMQEIPPWVFFPRAQD